MKKNNGKPASVLLAAGDLMLVLSGCAGELTETGAFTGTVSSTILQESKREAIIIEEMDHNVVVSTPKIGQMELDITASEVEFVTSEVTVEPEISNDIIDKVPQKEEVKEEISYTDLTSYCQYLDTLQLTENPLVILLNSYEYSEKEVEIAAYQNLKAHGLSVIDILPELHNLLVFSQYPTCLPEDEFAKVVGKLGPTLGEFGNPFDSYRVLAQRVHELTCEHVHTLEYGIYSCETLKQEGEIVRPISLMEYLDQNISENYGFQKIKNAIEQNPELCFNDYVIELENLIVAQLTPTGLSDELWLQLFGKLDATLDGYESLYETYIELAVYVHNLLYPEDMLTKNDFDIYTSRTLTMPNA